ncbi:hypothetical protein MSIM_04800 [Mycobacterium simiae]|nr:hypothetical protein MSIM_04800 [Mycobacterium simiae]
MHLRADRIEPRGVQDQRQHTVQAGVVGRLEAKAGEFVVIHGDRRYGHGLDVTQRVWARAAAAGAPNRQRGSIVSDEYAS